MAQSVRLAVETGVADGDAPFPAVLLRQLADQQQGGDAVLVADVVGVAAVAQRLLVAEGQALDATDPLDRKSVV